MGSGNEKRADEEFEHHYADGPQAVLLPHIKINEQIREQNEHETT